MHKANMFEVYIVPHILQKCTVSFGLFLVYCTYSFIPHVLSIFYVLFGVCGEGGQKIKIYFLRQLVATLKGHFFKRWVRMNYCT
jgi:hypothetical protein